MRKFVLIVVTLLLWVADTSAHEVYVVRSGEFVQTENAPTAKKSVVRSNDTIRVTYTIDSLIVVRNANNRLCFELEGFGLSMDYDRAATLNTIDRIVAAPSCRVVLDSYSTSYRDLSGELIAGTVPAKEIETDIQKEHAIPVIDRMLPELPIAQLQNENFRSKSIARILINPVQYNSNTKTIRIHNSISYTLTQIEVDELSIPRDSYAEEYWNNNFLNFVEAELDQSTRPVDCEYLILTNSTLVPAANKIAAWKNDCGFKTTIIANDFWTTTGVNSTVKDFYNSHPNFYYLLILGDQTVVPANTRSRCGETYVTDFPYACMDGSFDYVPDICVGRLPYSDLKTMTNVVQKTIAYERDPSFDAAKSTFAFCSYFQDDNNDGVEDRGFIFHTQRAWKYAVYRVDTALRLYYAKSSVTPLYWSPYYGTGMQVPQSLRRPQFSWDDDKNDIIAAFNNGCHVFFHRDHGNVDGWAQPTFKTSDIASLHNDIHPIVFSLDCLTGDYTANNSFAKNLLMPPNSGCAAIIAASDNSYSLYNDAFLCGIMSSIWSYPGLRHKTSNLEWIGANTYEDVVSIGEIMNQGLLQMDETTVSANTSSFGTLPEYSMYQKEIYHCLGDPGLPLFWDSDADLSKSVRRNNCLSIGSGSSGVDIHSSRMVTIAFHDTITGEVSRQYGKEFFFEAKNPTAVKVRAFANGCRPAEIKSITIINPNPGIPALGDVNIGENTLTVTVADVPDDSASRYCISVGTDTGKKYEPLVAGQSIYSIDIQNTQPVQPGGFYVIAIEESGHTLSTLKVRR